MNQDRPGAPAACSDKACAGELPPKDLARRKRGGPEYLSVSSAGVVALRMPVTMVQDSSAVSGSSWCNRCHRCAGDLVPAVLCNDLIAVANSAVCVAGAGLRLGCEDASGGEK